MFSIKSPVTILSVRYSDVARFDIWMLLKIVLTVKNNDIITCSDDDDEDILIVTVTTQEDAVIINLQELSTRNNQQWMILILEHAWSEQKSVDCDMSDPAAWSQLHWLCLSYQIFLAEVMMDSVFKS